MLLAVDIGNSNITIGLFTQKRFLNFRISTNLKSTQDEYSIMIYNLFNIHSIKEKVDAAIISSVVPQVSEKIKSAIIKLFNIKVLEVSPGIKTGMPIKYDNPKEVGADRIVNAVSAYEEFKNALIVIDSGTAITFDVINKNGEYIGGAITPGINISADALAEKTAKLPRVKLKPPQYVIGKNTINSIQSGLVFGHISMIEGMIKKIQNEMGCKCINIATGGEGAIFYKHIKEIDAYRPHLTLLGLKIIYERNK